MLLEILATFTCDRCGTKFIVGLDPAATAKPGSPIESAFDIAVDAIRGGVDYREQGRRWMFKVSGSVSKSGKHLCADCTSFLDQKAKKEKYFGKQ